MAVRVVVMLSGQDRDVLLDAKFETVYQSVLSGSWLEDTGTTPNLRVAIDPAEVACIYEVSV